MQLGPEGDMSKGEMDMFFFPRQCMHCENPSCIEVCPTKATYQTDDGVVLIDSTRCFGCQYCMWACPYDARVIDPVKKVAQKCILCVHKLERGQLPECVKTCVSCARTAGDLNDPQSDISQLLSREWQRAFKIHEDFDNNPAVIYLKPRKGASKL